VKLTDLDHYHTPEALKQINRDIVDAFAALEINDQELLALIEKRDEYIQTFLPSLEQQALSSFVEAEMRVNAYLVTETEQLAKASLSQASELIRGRKLLKNYK
jgi:hypothetical protein